MQVKLIKIDLLSSDEEDLVLESGKNVIGRADFKCEDKRVSREHMEIDILSCGSVTVTALAINPVFYCSLDSGFKTTLPLTKGESKMIHDGDQISLLPDSLWFKIKFIQASCEIDDIKSTARQTVKSYKHEDKSSLKEVNSIDNCVNETDAVLTSADALDDSSCMIIEKCLGSPYVIPDDADEPEDVKKENGSSVTIKREQDTVDADESGPSAKRCRSASLPRLNNDISLNIKTEPVDLKTLKEEIPESAVKNEEASGSGNDNAVRANDNIPIRPLCMYGTACYRRNPVHRADFCHPSDADWRAPPDCRYGATCYRRSQRHRAKYNHVGPPAPRPPGKRNRAAKTKKRRPSWSGSCSDDEYDLEDPFMAGDSSDDYQPSSSSYTSDYSD